MSSRSPAACDDFSRELGALTDRRDWHREPARDTDATLSWQQDDGPQSHPADLLNIGGGGVGLLTGRVPPRGRLLCLRLRSLETIPVEGRVIDVKYHYKPGKHLIRIKFSAECPAAFFERAVHGKGKE